MIISGVIGLFVIVFVVKLYYWVIVWYSLMKMWWFKDKGNMWVLLCNKKDVSIFLNFCGDMYCNIIGKIIYYENNCLYDCLFL